MIKCLFDFAMIFFSKHFLCLDYIYKLFYTVSFCFFLPFFLETIALQLQSVSPAGFLFGFDETYRSPRQQKVSPMIDYHSANKASSWISIQSNGSLSQDGSLLGEVMNTYTEKVFDRFLLFILHLL